MMRSMALAAAVALAPVLAACASSGAPPAPQADPMPLVAQPPRSRADTLAEALFQAEQAERAADTTALAQAAQRLERLAPAPQTDDDAERLRRWLTNLPADASPMRGRALGPAYRSVALPPGAATQLNQTFLGGRSAQIVVKVIAGTAPDLKVRDQSAREVCRAGKDPVTCRWMPLYTQRHNIEIVNEGRAMSKFYIVFD